MMPLTPAAASSLRPVGMFDLLPHWFATGSYENAVNCPTAPPITYITPSWAAADVAPSACGIGALVVQVFVAVSWTSSVVVAPPTAYRKPPIATRPNCFRGVGIGAFVVHVFAAGSYSSTVPTVIGTPPLTASPPTA